MTTVLERIELLIRIKKAFSKSFYAVFLNPYPPDFSKFVELYIVDFDEKVTDSKELFIFNMHILSYPPFSLCQYQLTSGVRGYL